MNGLRVGWIGTGVMGVSMCKHLLNASYKLTVFNRTAEKAKPLLEMGAQWSEPKEIASQVDVLFLMLGFPKDVENMVLGDNGVLKHMKKGYFEHYSDQFWLITPPANPIWQSKSTNKQKPLEFRVLMLQFQVAT